jgi:hypothetical protein
VSSWSSLCPPFSLAAFLAKILRLHCAQVPNQTISRVLVVTRDLMSVAILANVFQTDDHVALLRFGLRKVLLKDKKHFHGHAVAGWTVMTLCSPCERQGFGNVKCCSAGCWTKTVQLCSTNVCLSCTSKSRIIRIIINVWVYCREVHHVRRRCASKCVHYSRVAQWNFSNW